MQTARLIGIWFLTAGHVLVATRLPSTGVKTFTGDVRRYYCDAGWVCKDLARMPLNEVAECWQQLTMLMTNRTYQWFYQYDTPEQYEQFLTRIHRSFDDFVRDSVDVWWINECAQYHRWISTHVVDNVSGALIEKEVDWDKSAYTELSVVLWTVVPDAMGAFYAFYFEKQVNVLFKKLNYLFLANELETNHLAQVMHDKEHIKNLYTICVHQTKQLSEVATRELAYHYRRVDDVYNDTIIALAQRFGSAQ